MRNEERSGMALFIGAALVVVALAAQCSKSDDYSVAERALRAQGFTAPKVTSGHAWAGVNGCDENDGVAYDATATNAQGNRVRLVVCCGLVLKGCTVRSP